MMSEIKLRTLTTTDLPKTLQWHNQGDNVQLYSVHPFPVEELFLNNIEVLNLFERVDFF
jgi:hypothetical protein